MNPEVIAWLDTPEGLNWRAERWSVTGGGGALGLAADGWIATVRGNLESTPPMRGPVNRFFDPCGTGPQRPGGRGGAR